MALKYQVERYEKKGNPPEHRVLAGPLSLKEAESLAESHEEPGEPYTLCIRVFGKQTVHRWYPKNGYRPGGALSPSRRPV